MDEKTEKEGAEFGTTMAKTIPSTKLNHALESAPESDTVADMCEYQCRKCDKKFTRRSQLYKHFKKTLHADSKRIYYANYLVKVTAFRCRICSRKILCDKETIARHLKSEHKVGALREYCQQMKVDFAKKHKEE